jgi:hypothetical protein
MTIQKLSRTFILLIPFLFGCTVKWAGSLSSNLAIPPENYHVVERVSGTASTNILFHLIGGLNHQNLVEEAKSDLIFHHPLDSHQVYSDWSVSIASKSFIFGTSQVCEVRASIISLVKPKVQVLTGIDKKDILDSLFTNHKLPGQLNPKRARELKKGDVVAFKIGSEVFNGNVLKINGNSVKIEYVDFNTGEKLKINQFTKDVQLIP